jgi:hypothetical protein
MGCLARPHDGFLCHLNFLLRCKLAWPQPNLGAWEAMESVTSGADIIKRLVKHGYVEEFDDEDDKRSRRVRITQVGKLLIFKIFEEMDTVSSIITGNLTGDEKLFLLHYLNKLDNLHTDIYNNDRKAELEAIKMKYIIE